MVGLWSRRVADISFYKIELQLGKAHQIIPADKKSLFSM